jgi:hypothetical protein
VRDSCVQPPEYASCKACDEEQASMLFGLQTQEHIYFLEGETPNGAKHQGGSPHAPRKASILERKSTTSKSNKDYLNNL